MRYNAVPTPCKAIDNRPNHQASTNLPLHSLTFVSIRPHEHRISRRFNSGSLHTGTSTRMGGQVSKIMGKIFGSREMRLLMLGLDAAGKTSMQTPCLDSTFGYMPRLAANTGLLQQSSTSSSSTRTSQRSPPLALTLRPSHTRMLSSTSGMWEDRIRYDRYGDIIFQAHKG